MSLTTAMYEAVFQRRTARRHTAIVLVSVADRRIVPALRFVSRLARTEVRALHISVDSEETRQLAADWMQLDLTWLPLHIHDSPSEDLLGSVRQAVEQEADETGEVVVIVPELQFTRWWQPLLHRRTARRIAVQLQPLPRVTTVIVPFAPLPGRTRDPVSI
jgi:hypothetical protein